MGKLQDYYRLFDMFSGKLSEEQKKILEGLEDQLIAEEILPAISESVAPVLSTLRQPLTFVLTYDPTNGIVVNTTREKVSILDQKSKKYRIKQDPVQTEKATTRNASVGFSVRFSDGILIKEKDAKETFVKAIQLIGLDKVASYEGRSFAGYPLVGKLQRTDGDRIWQKEVDGWWVYTYMSNDVKIKVLKELSDLYKLKLDIYRDDEKMTIISKPLDLSLCQSGTTIPKSEYILMKNQFTALKEEGKKSVPVSMLIKGVEHEISLYYKPATQDNPEVYQLLWSSSSDLAQTIIKECASSYKIIQEKEALCNITKDSKKRKEIKREAEAKIAHRIIINALPGYGKFEMAIEEM